MQLLVWCPTISRGGGERLLSRLVEAWLENLAIKKLGIAIPEDAVAQFAGLRDPGNKLDVVKIPHASSRQWNVVSWLPELQLFLQHFSSERRRRSLQQHFDRLSQHYDIAYVFWGQQETFVRSHIPVVVTIQDLTTVEFPEILGARVTTAIHDEIQKWLSVSIGVVSSRTVAGKVRSLFPNSRFDPRVVHHAISPNEKRHTSTQNPPEKGPPECIVYPANITVHKNHYNLLAAWARWNKRAENPLLLIGPGTELLSKDANDNGTNLQATRLRGLISRLGLRDQKDFFVRGYVSDSALADLVGNARALVMPSLAEGGGSFPVEEALSFGIPVLCSDIPVMREHLAGRSELILWFDPESPESIVRALERLDDDYDSVKKTTVSAMNYPRPTWNDVANEYVSIFQSALKERRGTATP